MGTLGRKEHSFDKEFGKDIRWINSETGDPGVKCDTTVPVEMDSLRNCGVVVVACFDVLRWVQTIWCRKNPGPG